MPASKISEIELEGSFPPLIVLGTGMPRESSHATGVGLDHWGDSFPSTHWSILLDENASGPATERLLARVCEGYWYPLYAYLRKRGRSSQDAQDLTQGFLCKLLENDGMANASPERGRLRSYLLAGLKNYENDVRKWDQAEKRGGGKIPLSIEEERAEKRYQNEPADGLTPEKLFDREWAMAFLQDVITQLKAEYEDQGKPEIFAELKEFISVKPEKNTYPHLAEKLGVSEGNVRVMVNRLRKRYKSIILDNIAQTVNSPEEVDAELQYLMGTFSD
ncbi:MAG: RNA polymerase sigma factor (sigma-70 family) [Verrucomicrobiales bacterium]|jgi:RNA polymerase sigma factor (sigma-70 family)